MERELDEGNGFFQEPRSLRSVKYARVPGFSRSPDQGAQFLSRRRGPLPQMGNDGDRGVTASAKVAERLDPVLSPSIREFPQRESTSRFALGRLSRASSWH